MECFCSITIFLALGLPPYLPPHPWHDVISQYTVDECWHNAPQHSISSTGGGFCTASGPAATVLAQDDVILARRAHGRTCPESDLAQSVQAACPRNATPLCFDLLRHPALISHLPPTYPATGPTTLLGSTVQVPQFSALLLQFEG
jgi:hypothetical protein